MSEANHLYLHVPFAAHPSVCFEGYAVHPPLLLDTFVQALAYEIDAYAAEYAGLGVIDTIVVNGGTPSVLTLPDVFQLLSLARRSYQVSDTAEITFRVSPLHASATYFDGLKGAGVTRLDVDVQSFFDEDLESIGVPYDGYTAEMAVRHALATGFEHVSVNLAFGLPEQPDEYAAANLERAIRLGVDHIATFGVTETEAALMRRNAGFSDEELDPDLDPGPRYDLVVDYLADQGFSQYEMAHFSRSGAESRHALGAWRHDNLLGFGPSAQSLWTRRLPTPKTQIWSNIPDVERYQMALFGGQLPLEQRYTTTLDALTEDFMMMQLRTSTGLDLDDLAHRYGYDLLLDRIDALADLESAGLIHPIRNSQVRLTDEGRFSQGEAFEALLP
ncbi:MAG: coproporphyrinogen-III oxidase family protein [Bacteroidota bacterium]